MYEYCDRIIELLLAPDLTSINLNLKRIMQDLHRKIFDRIAKVIYQVGMTSRAFLRGSRHVFYASQ